MYKQIREQTTRIVTVAGKGLKGHWVLIIQTLKVDIDQLPGRNSAGLD